MREVICLDSARFHFCFADVKNKLFSTFKKKNIHVCSVIFTLAGVNY